MMTKLQSILLLVLLCLSLGRLSATDPNIYRYKVNLNNVVNDALEVELLVPQQAQADVMVFHFPKIIPGTYEIHNYGQFVDGLKAFDKKGKELPVERKDQNTWEIKAGKKLDRLTYQLQDTWDANLRTPLFEPSGTSFEAGKAFVLNHNACFGFFKGFEEIPFEVTYDRPNSFYASTALLRQGGDFDTDIFRTSNYHQLVDNPIMYCEPDTVNFMLGYGNIQISVYSPNGVVKAKELLERIKPMLIAQKKYLGDLLPVDRYVFILYLSPTGYPSGSVGALEHSRCSFFCLVEEKVDKISKIVTNIAAHEFFHIVTPLYIQSEEIFHFNYMNPKMSKHLWLYEGVVEYMAHHMQVRYGLVSQSDFLKTLSEKTRTAMRYKDGISLAEMSANCLVEPYAKQYNNIYYKGAMTALCLDLLLLKESNGKYDLQMLLTDLSKEFGQETPFKDDELFDKIKQLTKIPATRDFFKKYVEGIEKLPYEELLAPFGMEYVEKAMVSEISPLGGLENGALKTDTSGRFYIAKYDKLDDFGTKNIGFKADDVLLEWNGKPFTPATASGFLLTYLESAKEKDQIEIKVLRKMPDGSYEQKVLATTIVPIEVERKAVFRSKANPSALQLELRKAWLEPRVFE